jgi:hypothetical protein
MAKFQYYKPWGAKPWLMNIDQGVGQSRANNRDDVLLIQFILEALNKSSFRWKLENELKRDGICGPKTISAIKSFQKNILAADRVQDGAVDPIKLPNGTLFMLNFYYSNNVGTHWPNIIDNPSYPTSGIKSIALFV